MPINDMKSDLHSRMPCDTYISTMGGVSGDQDTHPEYAPETPGGLGVVSRDITGHLTVTETLSLHDGEPMHWWDWSGGGCAEPDDGSAGDRPPSKFRASTVQKLTQAGGAQTPATPDQRTPAPKLRSHRNHAQTKKLAPSPTGMTCTERRRDDG